MPYLTARDLVCDVKVCPIAAGLLLVNDSTNGYMDVTEGRGIAAGEEHFFSHILDHSSQLRARLILDEGVDKGPKF
jgi:hypothetical protein